MRMRMISIKNVLFEAREKEIADAKALLAQEDAT